MRYDSPLRYPGGKASLAAFLARAIELNGLSGCSYVEPFAGGAGAALRLLRTGVVSEVHLNDLDSRIAAFWRATLNESSRFVDAILTVPVTVAEWKRQKLICQRADEAQTFELGFATFYLNRCNRSGVVRRAAPIGGHAQTGKWRIDARFNRETLAARVLELARRREQIHVTNMDARAFLVDHLSGVRKGGRVFGYLDPPYYSHGARLYMNSYKDEDHKNLALYVQRRHDLAWVMSYDDTPYVRDLYSACVITHHSIQYSLQRKQRAQELLIAPRHVQLPVSALPTVGSE